MVLVECIDVVGKVDKVPILSLQERLFEQWCLGELSWVMLFCLWQTLNTLVSALRARVSQAKYLANYNNLTY